jgi:hypothetical protein
MTKTCICVKAEGLPHFDTIRPFVFENGCKYDYNYDDEMDVYLVEFSVLGNIPIPSRIFNKHFMDMDKYTENKRDNNINNILNE